MKIIKNILKLGLLGFFIFAMQMKVLALFPVEFDQGDNIFIVCPYGDLDNDGAYSNYDGCYTEIRPTGSEGGDSGAPSNNIVVPDNTLSNEDPNEPGTPPGNPGVPNVPSNPGGGEAGTPDMLVPEGWVNITWDYWTDTKILTLAPCLQDIARNFVNYMESAYGIEIRVSDAFRTWQQQDIECAEGSSTVCGGYSYHNYGLAIDVVEISNGQALYTNPNWELIGSIGESFGLKWGGRWTSLVDKPHFQLSEKTIAELYNGADACN